MGKFVKSITRVGEDGSVETLYGATKKKRRVTTWLRPIERQQRRSSDAIATFGNELLARHNKSNDKRRNGWLKDGPENLMKAQRKATKKLFNL